MQVQPAAAAVNCTDSGWSVGNETDLNDAIVCYNAKPAGSYSITLTQNISLTASSTTISNATAGATLLLEGGDFTLDGQGTVGVRPIEIGTATEVTLQNITVTGGNITGSGGGIVNGTTLTTDQRGVTRPQRATDDIGAFELEGPTFYLYLPLILK